jgi:iron(III) transport system permease protein
VSVLAHPVVCSSVRAIVVASLALWLSRALNRRIRTATSWRRRVLLGLSLLPLFIPDLLIGFTYRLTAARLVDVPAATEVFYAIVLVGRCLAVGVAVRMFVSSSTVSEECIFLWDQLDRETVGRHRWRWTWLMLRMRGPWRPSVVAWCLMALITYQEFEIAALLQLDRHPIVWTVWLFDAHAAWQPLTDSMLMLQGPFIFESLLILPLTLIVRRRSGLPVQDEMTGRLDQPATGGSDSLTAWVGLVLAVLLYLIGPLLMNVPLIWQSGGLAVASGTFLWSSFWQVVVSLGFAVVAAAGALLLGTWCLRRTWRLIVVLPGMLGALASSLCWLALFQLTFMNWLYDTWLPLLVGLVSTNLPKAVLVLLALQHLGDSAAVHSARLLQSSMERDVRTRAAELIWQLVNVRWLLAAVIMTHWCFWDVTTVSILRPVDVEPVITRLYNEMHYGRTEALALVTLMACLATPAAGVTAAVCWRITGRYSLRNRR